MDINTIALLNSLRSCKYEKLIFHFSKKDVFTFNQIIEHKIRAEVKYKGDTIVQITPQNKS